MAAAVTTTLALVLAATLQVQADFPGSVTCDYDAGKHKVKLTLEGSGVIVVMRAPNGDVAVYARKWPFTPGGSGICTESTTGQEARVRRRVPPRVDWSGFATSSVACDSAVPRVGCAPQPNQRANELDRQEKGGKRT
jgi:hypothetical protein